MAKPNYELKAQVLKTDCCKKVKQYDRELGLVVTSPIYDNNDFDRLDNMYIDMLFSYGKEYIEEARRLNSSTYHKRARLNKKIKRYLESGNCLWVTLTFSNKTLESTSEETRKQYVRRYLKSNYKDYIANIDYGSKNDREHYHAIIRTDYMNLKEWHQYGAIKVEHIRTNDVSIKKLSKYVTKLTNHAVKETCKRCHIIYSRDVQS